MKIMSPKFFLMLLPLLFCLSLKPVITYAEYISYDALHMDDPKTGGHRLLHLNFHPLSHPQPSTGAGLLIKNACLDSGLDYLGRLCSTILGSAPPMQDNQCEAKALAIFALQETEKIVANASVQVKEGLVQYGQGMNADLSVAVKGCEETWYVQAQSQINGAITKLTTQSPNAQIDATNAINGALTDVRTCYFDLVSKKFLKGDSRVFVNKINGHNQLLKRMLAASQNLLGVAKV